MISIFVVIIIAGMLFPVFTTLQARAERTKCTSNLHTLHIAANLYVQDNHSWPQLGSVDTTDTAAVAGFWLGALAPYGLTQPNWICPTMQHILNSPDLSLPENKRVDYMSTSFNTNPQSPYLYSTQPWFAEVGDVHGNGNLIIFFDGHVESLREFTDRMVPKK